MAEEVMAVPAQVDRGVVRHALLLACLVFEGCGPTPTARADARIALFRECMELAAKMPRQADDDVADVVHACSNQAFYMTNHIQ